MLGVETGKIPAKGQKTGNAPAQKSNLKCGAIAKLIDDNPAKRVPNPARRCREQPTCATLTRP